MAREKIAVLGGGMGSLSTVFWLTSQPDWQERYDITVYQQGFRLGGKVASSHRAEANGRSEEHGFHVALGFYNNVFTTMGKCYEELGRRPDQPLSAWAARSVEEEAALPQRFAVKRHHVMNVAQPFAGEMHHLRLVLPANTEFPGDDTTMRPFDIVARAATMLLAPLPGFPAATALAPARELVRRTVNQLLALAVHSDAFTSAADVLVLAVKGYMRLLWRVIGRRVPLSWPHYAMWIAQDFAASHLCGILSDRVLTKGFASLNDQEYCDWWMSHAAVPEGAKITAASTFGSLPYNLVFGYRQGDSTSPPSPERPIRGKPCMEAGTMLRGTARFLFGYKGAPTWMFQAGCGEALAAPLYQVLRRRGVKIEFFHRVRALHLDAERKHIGAITVEQQATPKAGYDPLIEHQGVPCWPAEPRYEQLAEGEALRDVDLESHWAEHRGRDRRLVRGQDFDRVLLGISIGALPALTEELSAASPKWHNMLRRIETNRTLLIQAWFDRTLEEMRCPAPTINGDTFAQPVNLLTSMNQILNREGWPAATKPKALIYYSGVMPDDPNEPQAPQADYPKSQRETIRQVAREMFERDSGVYLPASLANGGFDWQVLTSERGAIGAERLEDQYYRVNINPSERYVLSVPGSSAARLAAGESGFANLTLAGDWLRTGLDSGCLEAAVMSGMQASRAISGFPAVVTGETDWD